MGFYLNKKDFVGLVLFRTSKWRLHLHQNLNAKLDLNL